ncbi:MAG: S-methyl-5-thioribose kinase [Clostridia bacterium]|nr:S-methyl-5-thioribose kinase [Clostridia bacterium]
MSKYYVLDVDRVFDYIQKELNYFDHDADVECNEIGDGNLNLVFRVVDKKHGKSIIVKQSLPYVRCVGEEWPLNINRAEIENRILKIEYNLTNGLVPRVYKFDPVMYATLMEDLSDHVIMRRGLMELNQYPRFIDQITDFMVKTLLMTSDIVMDHQEKKAYLKDFINPELCDITEALVYTEPFYNAERNKIDDFLIEFMENNVWNDKELKLEVAKLKFDFMTNAQALLHGDLHTGSIFVKEDSTKVIDPEFAFYGPMAYDIGALIANLVMNYISTDARIENRERCDVHNEYLLNTMRDVIDLFKEKFLRLFDEVVTDEMAKTPGFKEWYLDNVIIDTAGVTGCEMIRRTVGLAHVQDLDDIPDIDKQAQAKRTNVFMAKDFIMERKVIKTGQDFVDMVKRYYK